MQGENIPESNILLSFSGGICAIKPDSKCRAAFPVYYYNHEKKSCKFMTAGGCHQSGWDGFDTLQQCEQTCQGSSNARLAPSLFFSSSVSS